MPFSQLWLSALYQQSVAPAGWTSPLVPNRIIPWSPKRGRKVFQAQRAILGDETSSHYFQKKKGMGRRVAPKPTVTSNSALGKVPLDEERCFNFLEYKAPLQLSLSYSSQRMPSSSNHNLFGSARVAAHGDSKAQPQAWDGERFPRSSRVLLFGGPSLEAGGHAKFLQSLFLTSFRSSPG